MLLYGRFEANRVIAACLLGLSLLVPGPLPASEQDIAIIKQAYKERDCDKVDKLGNPLAEKGNSKAQLIIGLCKLRIRSQQEEAVVWLDKALRNGEASAAPRLAIYYSGLASKENNKRHLLKTCEYSEMGARLGDETSKGYVQGFNCKQVYKDAEAGLFDSVDEPTPTVNGREILFTYLGKPITFTSEVSAFCRDDKSGMVVDCNFRLAKDGRYWIDHLPPGRYVLRVEVDENKHNPPEGPGDYWRYFQFKVGNGTDGPLRVSMQKLIHLIAPADNSDAVEGNSSKCEEKRHFEVPLLSPMPQVDIPFSWQPLDPGVEYHYTLWKANCGGGGMQRLAYKQTKAMQVIESLPPNESGEFYLFRITAVKNGEMVGDFFLRDSGGSGMRQYRFRVSDPLGNRYYIYYGLAALLLIILLLMQVRRRKIDPEKNNPASTASGSSLRVLLIILFVTLLGAGGYYGFTYYQNMMIQEELTKKRNAKEEKQAHMRAEFELSVPLPEWWSQIGRPKFLFNTHSDVVAIGPKINYAKEALSSRRTIIKQCYLSIVAHADDDNLVTACLSKIANLEKDMAVVRKVVEFGITHYHNHKSPTDYCSGCKPGDTIAGIVSKAASIYNFHNEYDKTVAVINRFLKTRKKDTRGSRLEILYATLGNAYWENGQREKAVKLMEQAYQRYGKKGKQSNLIYYLERYRKKLAETTVSQQTTHATTQEKKNPAVESEPDNTLFPKSTDGRWSGKFNAQNRIVLANNVEIRGIDLTIKGASATVSLIDLNGQHHDLENKFSVQRKGTSMTLTSYISAAEESGLWAVNIADVGAKNLSFSVTAIVTTTVNSKRKKKIVRGSGVIGLE